MTKCIPLFPCSCVRLDAFLGTSVLKHDVTIVSGPPGMGKTQFVYTVLSRCLAKRQYCLYISGGCNLVIERLCELLQSQCDDVDACLAMLYLETGHDAYDLYDMLEKYASVKLLRFDHF